MSHDARSGDEHPISLFPNSNATDSAAYFSFCVVPRGQPKCAYTWSSLLLIPGHFFDFFGSVVDYNRLFLVRDGIPFVQSRVVSPAIGERNFHIFYMILNHTSPQDQQEFQLQPPDYYYYLYQSENYTADGIDDGKNYQELLVRWLSSCHGSWYF